MVRIRLGSLFVVMQVLLVGCGAGVRVDGNYDLNVKRDKGLVAFSARVAENNCDGLSSLNANVYKVDGGGFPSPFAAKNPIIKPHYAEGGYFYVIEYEAGEYKIGKVQAAGFTMLARSTNEFDLVQFSVKANEVHYLGELEFSLPGGCGGVSVKVNDRWERDSALFEARVPNISASVVNQSIITTSER